MQGKKKLPRKENSCDDILEHCPTFDLLLRFCSQEEGHFLAPPRFCVFTWFGGQNKESLSVSAPPHRCIACGSICIILVSPRFWPVEVDCFWAHSGPEILSPHSKMCCQSPKCGYRWISTRLSMARTWQNIVSCH